MLETASEGDLRTAKLSAETTVGDHCRASPVMRQDGAKLGGWLASGFVFGDLGELLTEPGNGDTFDVVGS